MTRQFFEKVPRCKERKNLEDAECFHQNLDLIQFRHLQPLRANRSDPHSEIYDWVFVDRISNMLANSHTQGWNQYLDSNTLLRLVGVFQWTNPILKVLTLTVELGILFFFFRVGWTRVVLIAAIFLHIGIFFTSGICFWFWCSIHVFFLLYVWRSLEPEQQETCLLYTSPSPRDRG